MKKAHEARTNKILDTKMRFDGVIMSRRDWLNMWRIKGATAEERQVPLIQYSRTKYNRLSGWEQEEYEKKCAQTKIGYSLRLPDGNSSYDITKTEYDYFNNMELAEDFATEKNDINYRIEAGVATESEINEAMQKEYDFAAKYF
jgi:hypothetical protein